jgi:hypothetical protein
MAPNQAISYDNILIKNFRDHIGTAARENIAGIFEAV